MRSGGSDVVVIEVPGGWHWRGDGQQGKHWRLYAPLSEGGMPRGAARWSEERCCWICFTIENGQRHLIGTESGSLLAALQRVMASLGLVKESLGAEKNRSLIRRDGTW